MPHDSTFTLLTETYAAFNARDVERALSALDREVEWANGMNGGYVHGRNAVREYWTNQWKQIDPRVDPVAMAADQDGRIVVDVHQVVHDRTGALLADRMVQHVYTIANGLVTLMEIREK
jgi:nuclear transport factor 2 (NTF2) superfamily protein